MSSPWSFLPNSKHIDRVISSIDKHTTSWLNTYDELLFTKWDTERADAINKSRIISSNMGRSIIWDYAWDIVWDPVWNSTFNNHEFSVNVTHGISAKTALVWLAVAGLITYDTAGYLLYSDPNEVKLLANLGTTAATLLLPASMVFNKEYSQ